MKHTVLILVTALLALMSLDAKAQGLVYTPFIPERPSSFSSSDSWNSGSRSSRSRSGNYLPSSQTQVMRTTAYHVDYNGNYYKVPIRVDYTVYSNGASSLTVAEQWEANAAGGQWRRISSPARVVGCQAITANGITAELERSFMYKAMVGTVWYYFDL